MIISPNKTPQNMVDAYHFVSKEWHRLLFPESIQLLSNRTDDPDDLYHSFMLALTSGGYQRQEGLMRGSQNH
jgi:hypothetical protein